MAMGIIVTAFTLFGMLALVLFNDSLAEPTQTQPRAAKPVAKSKPRVRVAEYAADAAHAGKKAA